MRLDAREAAGLPGGSRLLGPLVGALLLAILTPAVLTLPLAQQVAVPIAAVLGFALLTRPTQSLFVIFATRAIVDLLWWAPGSVFGLNVMELVSGVVAGLAMVLVLMHAEKVQRHPYFLMFLPFLLVMGMGAARAGDFRLAAELAAKFVSPIALMFLVSVLFTDAAVRVRLVRMLPLLGVVPVLLGFWHLANGQMNEYTLDGYGRLQGAYANIHNHAHVMALFASLGLFWSRRSRTRWEAIAWLVYVAACCVLMYLTYVRTALTGFVLFSLVFLALERQWRTLSVLGGLLFVGFTGSAAVQDRFSDIFQLFASDPGADTGDVGSGRIRIWTESLHGFARQTPYDWMFGVGFDNQRMLSSEGLDSHNDYLALLFQMGPVALIAYLLFQGMLIRMGLWLSAHAEDAWTRVFGRYVVALNVMVLVANFLSNSYVNRVNVGWFFWGLGGVVFAAYAYERRRHEAARAYKPGPIQPSRLRT